MKFMPGAEPLFLEGEGEGLLLIHGAGGGTAWDLKEFAHRANKKGFTVCLPALPGFGTDPSDLLQITFDDWINASAEGLERLREETQSVSLLGHSMGGVIALTLAAKDQKISRIVCWSTPWAVKHPLLPFLPLLMSIPLLRNVIPERQPTEIPTFLRDQGWVGYDWLPTSVGFVFLDALKRLRSEISNIKCPVLVVQGSKDEAVKTKSATEIIRRLSNPHKQVWIVEGATHPIMQDFCKEELFERSLAFLKEKNGS